MAKIFVLLFGFFLSTVLFGAEILDPTDQCDVQQKEASCVNNYCVLESVISESPDCTQLCEKCAEAACKDNYDSPPEECEKLSL